jgi:AraC-like DNA-binding protein
MPAAILKQLLGGEPLQLTPSDYLSKQAFSPGLMPHADRYVDLSYASVFGDGIRLSWNEPGSFGKIEAARFQAGFSFLMIEALLANHRVVTRYGDDCIVIQFFPRKTTVTGGSGNSTRALPACRLTRYAKGTARTQRLCSPALFSHMGIVLEPSRFMSITGITGEDMPEDLQQLCSPARNIDQVIEIPLTANLCESLGMLMNYNGTGAIRGTYFYAKLLEILVEVVRIGKQRERKRRSRSALSARDEDIIRKARDLIRSDLADNLTLEGIARRVGTNRTKLAYGFRLLFGQTVSDTVQETRLNQALLLLRSGRVSVTAVASEVGYADATTFGRAFKKRFGISPGRI